MAAFERAAGRHITLLPQQCLFFKQVWRLISVHFRRNLPGNSSPLVHMNQIVDLRH
jgi:hypothetical protein